MTATILSKRAMLVLGFLVSMIVVIAVPMLFVKAHQDEQYDDLFPPDRWQEVVSIVSDLNKNDGSWILSSVPPSGLSYFTTSWTVPSGGVVGVNVYGHSDDGGYCMAYWGGSTPGWVAEYRHDGQDGVYNVDNMSYSPCPTYPPSFDSSGNAQICQGGSSHGPFSYGKNSLGGDIGDIPSGISIPAGTVINLKADNIDGGGGSNVHCYLSVKYPSVISGYSSKYFPSNSSNFYVGTANDSTILCPDGAYVSGLRRWHTGRDEDPVAVYCSWQSLGQLNLPSASQGVASGSRRTDGIDLCADGNNGYYMAGINHNFSNGSGDKDPTQIYCAPAPSDYASGFQSTTNSTTSSPMNNNNTLYTCDDGYYMSGIGRDYIGGDNDRIQIYCSPAPIIPADIGESCSSQPCGYGFVCNSSNICVIPPPSRVDANGNSCELHSSGPEWTANYKPESGGAAYGYGTAVDTAGNIYVAGEAFNAVSANSGLDMFVSKYNSSGSRLWTKHYDDNGNEAGYGVAVDSSDRVYVTGRQDTNNGDIFLIRYDANGNQQAVTTRDDGRMDVGRGIDTRVGFGGGVYVAGYQQNTVGDIDMVLLRYGSTFADGELPNNSVFYNNGNSGTNESGYSVDIDPVGSVFVAGYQSTGGADMFLRKYDYSLTPIGSFGPAGSNGTVIYDSGNNQTDIGRGVSVSRDGNTVFVTGYQSSGGGDVFLNAYQTTDGEPKWSETYNSGGSQNDVGRAVAVGANSTGRVYIAGHQGTNNDDVFLREYFSSDYKAFLQNDTLISGLAYQDIAYGIAIGPASDNEPLYVSGYRASNEGEAFLSKYSCNAPTGEAGPSNGYFSVSPANIYTGTDVRVDATQSGPGISKYEWNWDYANNPSGFAAGNVKDEHIYNTTGSYTIALRITYTDLTLQPVTITQLITVYNNHQPTAAFEIATSTPPVFVNGPVSGSAPLVVTVNGADSDPDGLDPNYDPGDYIKNFIWDWGDGTPKGQGQQTTHLYSRPTSTPYIITLIVEDSVGASNSFSAPVTQTVTVIEQYVCSGGCGADEPVCGPTNDGLATQCYQCLSDTDCGSGYRCLGISCKQGQMCSDGVTECPADGRCPEATSCKAGDVCPDGTACPDSGICYSQDNKNTCVLSSDTQGARCYTEGMAAATTNGLCATDLDCTASLQGGTCDTTTGECRYARCLNETSFTCESDKDCNNSDGICLTGTGLCDYIYDCAYGPGMNDGATTTAAVLAPAMPAMPIGIQPDGEACTKPTPDAPNNCEGINGCLYYNYNGDGTTVAGDANNPIGSSVANCLNKFEGDRNWACVFYGDQSDPVNSRVNCLPGTDFSKLKSKTAPDGVPTGCVVIDKGSDKKEYDCTGVNNCYYYLNGVVDCDYMGGAGCIYEPSPAGATFCPRAFKTPTGGENFVQCLLNPDAVLPSFLIGSGGDGLSTCNTSADCPASAPVCINGTCYPACQGDVDCVTGGQCLNTCSTSADCQIECTVGTTCPSGAACQPDSTSPTGGSCPVTCISGVCVPPPPLDPNSFSCSDVTAVHKLDYGTLSADIAVRSSQNASCRWSLFDLSFDQMVSPVGFPLNTNDLVNHTASAVGFPSAGPSTIFVACDNGAGAVDSCNVPLQVGDPCSSDADCYGLICNNGWCQAPVCADAQPQGSLPYSALVDGTPISMTTTADSNCVYSNTYDNTNQCVAPILSCATATSFTATGGTAHSSFLPGSSLAVGNNYQYAKCQETAPPQSLSTTCTIPVRVLTCNPYAVVNECDNDWTCVGIGSGPGICIPPDCSGAKPTGTLPYTADNADIGMTTSVPATCAYSDNPSDLYDDMTAFTETGDLAHLSNISVERNSEVYRYAICNETATDEKTDVCTIRFKVGDLLPICGGAYPRGRQDVNVELPIGLTTNQSAVCKFADAYDNLVTPEERYNNMTDNFRSADGITHGRDGVLQDTVVVVQGDNTKYVACQETAVPNKITECRIPFSGRIGPCTGALGECEFGSVCDPQTDECVPPCESSYPPEWCWNQPKPNCSTMPWLPQCNSGPSFCALNPDAPECQTSCNTLGYEFYGTAILPSGNCDIVAIIMALLSWLAWIVALLAVLSGLRAAYLYITSAGDEKKLRLAYQYLIYTTIGVGVAIITFSLVAITRAILNI